MAQIKIAVVFHRESRGRWAETQARMLARKEGTNVRAAEQTAIHRLEGRGRL